MKDLMEHGGALKRQLVQFGEAKRFASDLVEAQIHYFDSPEPVSNPQYVSFLDYFLLQYRLSDGLTVVDHFVTDTPSLPQADKDILVGWKNVVEGLFEIVRYEGRVLVLDNLLDDLTYRARSNMGTAYFDKMLPGHFLRARIVPMGDGWMLSASVSMYPPSTRIDVLRGAAEAVIKSPLLMFRNPAKREQAIALQRAEKPEFVAFFGSDLVVLPVGEFVERMNAYMLQRWLQTSGSAAALAAGETEPDLELTLPKHLKYSQKEWGAGVETIGVVFDEVEGMEFHPNMGLVVEAFAEPEKATRRPYRALVSEYIQDPDMSMLPIRILAERDPERASQVFRNLFPLPDFDWNRDGVALLRKYKWDYENRAQPGTIPLSDRLLQALKTPLPTTAAPFADKKVGRNEPCPCGSGKKYKQCCG